MSQLHTVANPSLLTLAAFAAGIAMLVSFSVDASIEMHPAAAHSFSHQPRAWMGSAYELPTLAPSAIVLAGNPVYRVESKKVSFFFSGNRAELRHSAEEGLRHVADASKQGLLIQIAGVHESTNQRQAPNTALAHKRALAVQKRLLALGVPLSATQIRQPTVLKNTHARSDAEAQRVEVTWIPKP